MVKKIILLFLVCVFTILSGCNNVNKDIKKYVNYNGLDKGETQNLIISLLNTGEYEYFEKLYNLQGECSNYSSFNGEWHRTNTHSDNFGEIIITNADPKKFDFSVNVWYKAHSGEMENQAFFVSDTFAIAIFDEDWLDQPSYIAFIMIDDIITVQATGGSSELGFGMNVEMDGDYSQDEPIYTDE